MERTGGPAGLTVIGNLDRGSEAQKKESIGGRPTHRRSGPRKRPSTVILNPAVQVRTFSDLTRAGGAKERPKTYERRKTGKDEGKKVLSPTTNSFRPP